MNKLIRNIVIIAVIVIIVFAAGPFYVLNEGEQAVVTRFGAIINSSSDAGLKFKMPFVDNVVKYPKKLLSWDGDAQRIPTAENQFIWVDATARWQIADPMKFYESVTTVEQAYSRMDDVIDSSVRTVIAENLLREAVRNSNYINEVEPEEAINMEDEESLNALRNLTVTETQQELIEKGREALSEAMYSSAKLIVPQYGIELKDIIIRQIRYSDDLTQSVYNRMIKERSQVAQAYRSYGEGQKAEWLGKLDNDKRSILSEAYEKSESIKGTADAEATRIYSESYQADPEFFEFWRSIESYRKILPNFNKTLTTDMEYFDYLYEQEG
ncbi:MAG: protease modulator HflC [Spirochaetales bacterium]|uniref:Protein HflC n=1 Tax=Candidatus Thalassospirochaeta sargassi TaxID=3119039 RepID=A0AAJ1IEH6_9SPIO|nr:protease modulator HflC [Spirochaetales bacterium]